MKLPSKELKESIVRMRNTNPGEFGLLLQWVEDSLHDQTLTNEATQNPNVLLHGCGYAHGIRAIVLALKE